MKLLLLLLTLMLSTGAHAVINKGDTLTISIKGVPTEEQGQINGNYSVTKAGRIHLPYLSSNPINANGLTVAALSRRIEAAYRNAKIYTTPTISIQSLNDKQRESKRIGEAIQEYYTISGKVGAAGPRPYRSGLLLIDVVSAAGPTTFAAQNRVELRRNGKLYIYNLKLPAHMMVKIFPNDQIFLKEKNWLGR
jgi:protein involved in polysaccharide export with SLBB domain